MFGICDYSLTGLFYAYLEDEVFAIFLWTLVHFCLKIFGSFLEFMVNQYKILFASMLELYFFNFPENFSFKNRRKFLWSTCRFFSGSLRHRIF